MKGRRERVSELEILVAARDKLTAMASGTWTTNGFLVPMLIELARVFEETAAEYRPDSDGNASIVACGHCWDNVKLACRVLGRPEPADE